MNDLLRDGPGVARPSDSGNTHRVLLAAVALGALLTVASLFDEANRTRMAYAYVWSYALVWTLTLGALFFVALQHITRSVWSLGVRRVAEAISSPGIWLPAAFVPIALFVLLPESFPVFPWRDADVVAADHVLHEKQAYLNPAFFLLRAVVFLSAWWLFTRFYVGGSLAQDHRPDPAVALRLRRWAPPFMLVFAATVTLASVDWLMSLAPRWFSTIFGVYLFAGMVPAALAVITLATLLLRRSGRLDENLLTPDHLYSLGALLFAFSCFWAYIAFSQYMLIWYANIPEESFYIFRRVTGAWAPLSVVLALLRFGLPFLLLLSRRSKSDPRRLAIASVIIIVGQFLDLHWLVFPELHNAAPAFGWPELGPPLALVGSFLLLVMRFAQRHPLVVCGDPLLPEARAFSL